MVKSFLGHEKVLAASTNIFGYSGLLEIYVWGEYLDKQSDFAEFH